jgi:hypothetical protein
VGGGGTLCAPRRSRDRAHDEVAVPDDIRIAILECARDKLLQLGPAGDDQVTIQAVAALFVQDEQLPRLDVNDQRKLADVGLAVALGAPRKRRILVRVQKEAMPTPATASRLLRRFGARNVVSFHRRTFPELRRHRVRLLEQQWTVYDRRTFALLKEQWHTQQCHPAPE